MLEELYIQPILGYRGFQINESSEGYSISSPLIETPCTWAPGIHKAQCLSKEYPRCSDSPGEYCDCGIYAYHHFWFPRITDCNKNDITVAAAVAGKGKTFIHHDGWRTEEAQILCFYKNTIDEYNDNMIQTLSEQHEVPWFKTPEKFENFARSYAVALQPEKIPSASQLALF